MCRCSCSFCALNARPSSRPERGDKASGGGAPRCLCDAHMIASMEEAIARVRVVGNFSSEELARIAEMKSQGVPRKKIAEALSRSENSVGERRSMGGASCPTPPPPFAPLRIGFAHLASLICPGEDAGL